MEKSSLLFLPGIIRVVGGGRGGGEILNNSTFICGQFQQNFPTKSNII
jgi:hypothetical protein